MASDLWVNMGCGDRPAGHPWVNCDSWPPVAHDRVVDATRRWPWPDGTAGRVFMGQVIEHLPFPWGVRKALREAWRVLAPGGELVVICPDFLAMRERRVEADVWRNEATGMRRWPGDAHLWMPNRNVVRKEVERRFGNCTFENHLNLPASWPHGSRNPWDLCARAEKVPQPSLR